MAEKQKSPMNEFDSNAAASSGLEEMAQVPSYQEEPSTGGFRPDRLERIVAQSSEHPSTNWDEYGGRNLSSNGSSGLYIPANESGEDDQKAAMARMARERAEKRRAEEESRQMEQREKAAQRLRELDEKTGSADVLDAQADHVAKPRTLFDPNMPGKDSSLTLEKTSNLPNGKYPNALDTPEGQMDSREAYSRQPVIQLASYEDRDRGQRGAVAAPRMLYDPKSGSMVAVPSKDDSSAAGGRGRKERGKKGKNVRDKDVKSDSKQDGEAAKGNRKGKREKKSTIESASPAKQDAKKKPSKDRKLPRTCGVLYSRDNKGNFFCLDGCDGDLGYGAHSVPGGRIKNSDAYANYLEDQKRTSHEDGGYYKQSLMDTSFEADGDHGEVTLHTGFNIPAPHEVTFDWVKPSDKIELITGIDESPTLQATAKEWAPSQAALAAAAARLEGGSASLDGDEEDEDDGPVRRVRYWGFLLFSYLPLPIVSVVWTRL